MCLNRLLYDDLQDLKTLYVKHTTTLLSAIRREFSNSIARLHRVDYSKQSDPASVILGGSSPYMKDLQERMTFVRLQILAPYNVGGLKKEWYVFAC